MDESAVKAWVDENLEALMDLFGLPHWRITITFEPLEKATAVCDWDIKYEHALIKIDFTKIPDIKTLERVLKHELMHIVHAPFSILWEAIGPYLNSDALCDSIGNIYSFSKEMTVRNLERMHHAHMDLIKTKTKKSKA